VSLTFNSKPCSITCLLRYSIHLIILTRISTSFIHFTLPFRLPLSGRLQVSSLHDETMSVYHFLQNLVDSVFKRFLNSPNYPDAINIIVCFSPILPDTGRVAHNPHHPGIEGDPSFVVQMLFYSSVRHHTSTSLSFSLSSLCTHYHTHQDTFSTSSVHVHFNFRDHFLISLYMISGPGRYQVTMVMYDLSTSELSYG